MLPVIVTTHNRTGIADLCIRKLSENLDDIYVIVSDDRSEPWHLQKIKSTCDELGLHYKILTATNESFGLGASLNRGLDEAFRVSDIALRMEDDWILESKLNPNEFVSFLRNKGSAVRMGMMFRDRDELIKETDTLYRVMSRAGKIMTFNNQVALVHKRIYEKIGRYEENVSPEIVERAMAMKFNRETQFGRDDNYGVYWPIGWRTWVEHDKTLPFCHAGVSTLGHSHIVPSRYANLS